jgi:pilus assembly protein FimV
MRAWARWGVTPLLAAPLGAWALGFGDIELQSALNQPFKAQIALIATPEELQGLHISLASPETFARYGLDRPEFLSDLEFRVTTNAAGRAVVQVSSRESVAEPFVTLLVEANHARGKAFKEFTVLLDPPVLLPAPAVPQTVAPAETRPAAPSTSSGPISRPTPAPVQAAPPPAETTPAPNRAPEPAPRTRPETAPAPRSSDAPPRVVPTSAPDGTYGPVQRAETLWAIAQQFRPDGVSMNQMMVATYRANPQAFGGNMNVLHIGATLRLPDSSDFQELTTAVATAEVQRQTDEWVNRTPSQRTLRLLPPTEVAAAAPAPSPAQSTSRSAAPPPAAVESAAPPANAVASSDTEQSRLLALRNEELRKLQEQAAAPASPQPEEAPTQTAPGVDLEVETEKEPEQLFADEETPSEAPAQASQAAAPPPAQPVAVAPPPQEPSLVSQILGFVMMPILWIGVGVAALLLTALWYVRRRRQEPEDVTGRWEALESEVADEEVREATARMRRQAPEESIVVEEAAQPARREADDDDASEEQRPAATARTARIERAPLPPTDETMSSQTVINLDQADPVAEADFHMAYGLYDQAAELVQKALEAAPNRRDLKLKLLEVYFVWGNKDAFLTAAQNLRKEIGQKADADWDKVVIMGKQICPDERLFAEATAAAGQVDVDLEAGGDAPLDLAFDESAADSVDLDLGDSDSETGAFDLEATGTRGATASVAKGSAKSSVKAPPPKPSSKSLLDEGLDIGERTAAGLEKAFLDLGDDDEPDEDDRASQTAPDLRIDSLAITQESPTVEREARLSGMSTMELASAEAPTVETPTIESVAHNAPTVETRRVERPLRGEPPTVEQRGPSIAPDSTAEIDLDDLGLDVKDLEDLPHDLGELPASARSETDTREQPVLRGSDDVLSATGVTQVLHGDGDEDELGHRPTAVLSDEDATLLAPSVDDGDGTLTGTEVLEERFELDQTGDTSLVKSLSSDDNLDLNLDDLSAALHGADTVEQPRTGTFSRDIFRGGSTPLDLDVGGDAVGIDDPTGTEEVSPLDPQTMTEVGTKLDLARAYIDMGDPEGARSILEEVLDEGDPNQRREAQSLIDVLTA